MLSATPFKSDKVLYIITFSVAQQSIAAELSQMNTSLGAVFVHMPTWVHGSSRHPGKERVLSERYQHTPQ